MYVTVTTKSLCLGLPEGLSYLRYAEWCKYFCVFLWKIKLGPCLFSWGVGHNANIREDNKLFENVVGF